MTEVIQPRVFDASYASLLRSSKSDFVNDAGEQVTIAQHGAAHVESNSWPGWPDLSAGFAHLAAGEPIIETYVASTDGVVATSDNEPFVGSWLPLIEWLDEAVRSALRTHGVALEGDAYATASLTSTALLEGMAHMDDDTFLPEDSVGVVAIVGELLGPRIAVGRLAPAPLRPMGQVVWPDKQLQDFEADLVDHCACAPDQLVLFPQFGQLHAGPSAATITPLASHRQLLVYRASVSQ